VQPCFSSVAGVQSLCVLHRFAVMGGMTDGFPDR
jgi:hypothetical protein